MLSMSQARRGAQSRNELLMLHILVCASWPTAGCTKMNMVFPVQANATFVIGAITISDGTNFVFAALLKIFQLCMYTIFISDF